MGCSIQCFNTDCQNCFPAYDHSSYVGYNQTWLTFDKKVRSLKVVVVVFTANSSNA